MKARKEFKGGSMCSFLLGEVKQQVYPSKKMDGTGRRSSLSSWEATISGAMLILGRVAGG